MPVLELGWGNNNNLPEKDRCQLFKARLLSGPCEIVNYTGVNQVGVEHLKFKLNITLFIFTVLDTLTGADSNPVCFLGQNRTTVIPFVCG